MKTVLSLLLLSVIATGTAFAAEPPQTPAKPASTTMDHSKMAMPDSTTDTFAALDANKDGFLSKAELVKHPMAAHAGMVDANKDGKLSRSEFDALQKM
jgi:Ca2+-binding EF-hand superfamily protein